MKKTLLLSLVFTSFVFCKSQIISLEERSLCENGNCPNFTTVKDINNILNKFTGVWKGIYEDGRTYEFNFIKKNDFSLYGGKPWDRLLGRLLAKKAGGQELVNTLSVSDDDAFSGSYFDKELKKYQLYFSFNADCNDKGYIYISFPNPGNLNQMRLVFMQERDIIKECSNGYKTVIPDAKAIILTKQ